MPPLPDKILWTETVVSLSKISDSRQTNDHLCFTNLVNECQTSIFIGYCMLNEALPTRHRKLSDV